MKNHELGAIFSSMANGKTVTKEQLGHVRKFSSSSNLKELIKANILLVLFGSTEERSSSLRQLRKVCRVSVKSNGTESAMLLLGLINFRRELIEKDLTF